MKLFDDPAEEQKIWEVRESGLGATAHEPGGVDTWPGWEDSAVPPDRVGDYLARPAAPLRPSTATTPRCTGTSARAASTRASTSTS